MSSRRSKVWNVHVEALDLCVIDPHSGQPRRPSQLVVSGSDPARPLASELCFRASELVEAVERVRRELGTPESIVCDWGAEFVSRPFVAWARRSSISVVYRTNRS